MRAAIGGGFGESVTTFEEVVKRKKDGVQAANPYGCNQYGHKPGCPHGGGVPGYKVEVSGAEARRLATEALREVVGKKLRNSRFGIEAMISGNSLKKIVSGNALGTSFRNLVDAGFCDKDTAFRIHMVAVANLPELFANAPNKEEQEVYHEQASRETATHLYSPFNVEGGVIDLLLQTYQSSAIKAWATSAFTQ